MPRVLFLANASSIHSIRWVNAILSKGYEVHLLSLQPISKTLDEKIYCYRAPFPPSCGYFANWIWVRRLIAKIEPDLVHAHYASGYGTLAALANFHPTILSVWGADIYDFPKQSFLHKNLIKFNLAKADKVLSTSHVMAREIRKYTDKPIELTPFGIDLSLFRPWQTESLFDSSDIVIGTIKTLEEKYGVKYLIKAFRLLRERHPDLPLKLLIVGNGPQEPYLKNLVKYLGIEKDTIFTGSVVHDEVPKYQNMLTVSVSVSVLDSESFGVAVIEASACEKPVVVSNVGGLPEVIEDGVSGFIVQPKNPQQTADAIDKLILDENLRISMGKAGRERVVRLFNWKDNVEKMTKIYKEMLS